jgi:hypothetical protein
MQSIFREKRPLERRKISPGMDLPFSGSNAFYGDSDAITGHVNRWDRVNFLGYFSLKTKNTEK